MLVVPSATLMLVDLFVAVMKVTVSVAIMQLEVFATHMPVKISASNMWVTVLLKLCRWSLSCNHAGGIFYIALRTSLFLL